MLKTIIMVIGSILLFSTQLQSQNINGLVRSAKDNTPVEGAHIINVSNSKMAISTSNGQFEIVALVGDTLVVSNISFETKHFKIKENSTLKIFLTPAQVQLEEVIVTNMPENEHDFKRKILDMDMQPTQDFIVQGLAPVAPKSKIPPAFNLDQSNSLGFAITQPLKFVVRKFNKDFQDKAKYYKLKANQGQVIRVEQKFDRTLVKQLTHLEEDELTAFIKFLDIDPSFLIRASEYEIALHIQNKYKVYQALQEPDSTQVDATGNG